MPTYRRLPADADLRRPYTVTVGLHPGYGNQEEPPPAAGGWCHGPGVDPAALARSRVLAAHEQWMVGRIANGDPYLTGVFTDGLVSYAWPRPETGLEPASRVEPCLVLSGDVSVLYAAHLTDAEVVDMLDDLAAHLAHAADQTRVYVAYRDRTWVLEQNQ